MESPRDGETRAWPEAESDEPTAFCDAIGRVAIAVSHQLDWQQAVRTSLEVAETALRADAAAIWSADDEARALRFVAGRGLPDEAIAVVREVSYDSDLYAARVARERRVMAVEDLDSLTPEESVSYWRTLGYCGLVAVPLLARGRLAGVMVYLTRACRAYSPSELSAISTIGSIIGLALDNARAYSALAAERAQLQEVIGQLPAGVFIAEAPSAKLVRGNEQVARIWRQPPISTENIESYGRWKGFHLDNRPYLPEEWPLARSIREGIVVRDEEIAILRGDGSCGTISVTSALIRDEAGRIVAGVVVFADVTARKKAEEALRESDERFRATFEQAPVGVVHATFSGQFVRVNERFSGLVDYRPDDLRQMSLQDVTYPLDLDAGLVQLQRLIAGETPTFAVEQRLIRRDGSLVWVNLNVSRVLGPTEDERYLIAFVEDISERKRIDEERTRLLSELRTSNLYLAEASGRTRQKAAEAQALSERLRLIQSITELALARPNLDEVLNTLLVGTCGLLDADGATIMLVAEDGQTLVPRASHGLEEEITRRVEIPVGKGITGRIFASRQPLIIPDISAVEVWSPVLRERARSLLGVPLLVAGRAIGVLLVGAAVPRDFAEVDLRSLRLIAGSVTSGIERAQLLEAERSAREEAERERDRARTSEETLRAIVDNSPAAIFLKDLRGRYILANRTTAEFHGCELGELIGKTDYDTVPKVAEALRANDRQIVESGDTRQFEEETVLPKGRRLFLSQKFPVRDARGSIYAIGGVSTEITERRRSEQEREELLQRVQTERALLQAVLKQLPSGVIIADLTAGTLITNDEAARIWGLPSLRGQPLGQRPWRTGFRPDGHAYEFEEWPLERALRGEMVIGEEIAILRADGECRMIVANAAPIRTPDSQVQSAVVVFADITERKEAEKALRAALTQAEEGRRILESLMENAPEGITIADAPDARIRMVSRHGIELLGVPHANMTVEEVVNQWRAYQPDGITPMPLEDLPLVRAIRTGEVTRNQELVQINAAGQRLFLSCDAGPIRDASGAILGGVIRWREISERKQAEAERERLLAEVEHRAAELDAIVESMAEGLIVINQAEDIIRINRAALQMIGASSAAGFAKCHEVCEGLNVRDRDGSHLPIEERAQSRALRGEEFVEQEILIARLDGLERRLLSTASPVRDKSGEAVLAVGVYRDVTRDREAVSERERLLAQVREVNERLVMASIVAHEVAEESARRAAELDAIISSIGDALIVYAPDGSIIRMNNAAQRLMGYSEAERAQPIAERAERLRFFTTEGTPVPTDESPAMRALRGESVVGEVLRFEILGRRSVWISASAVPVQLPDGHGLGVVLVMSDVTRLHELQIERDAYIHTISHDLRAPLAVILGQGQIVQRAADRPDVVRRAIDAIVLGARRMNVMIEDLVDSARIGAGTITLKRSPADLPKLIRDFLERSRESMPTGRVSVESQPDVPMVSADPARLERILANLVSNALKYSPDESPVTVRIDRGDGEVVVSVIDRGQGIAPDELPHLFKRYYRARAGLEMRSESWL